MATSEDLEKMIDEERMPSFEKFNYSIGRRIISLAPLAVLVGVIVATIKAQKLLLEISGDSERISGGWGAELGKVLSFVFLFTAFGLLAAYLYGLIIKHVWDPYIGRMVNLYNKYFDGDGNSRL